MLFAGWEVRIVKTEVTVFHYTDRPKPVNNLFFFLSLSLKRLCLLTSKNSRKRYCDRGQRRKIRTALRTNQITEFVSVTAWKKKN